MWYAKPERRFILAPSDTIGKSGFGRKELGEDGQRASLVVGRYRVRSASHAIWSS